MSSTPPDRKTFAMFSRGVGLLEDEDEDEVGGRLDIRLEPIVPGDARPGMPLTVVSDCSGVPLSRVRSGNGWIAWYVTGSSVYLIVDCAMG